MQPLVRTLSGHLSDFIWQLVGALCAWRHVHYMVHERRARSDCVLLAMPLWHSTEMSSPVVEPEQTNRAPRPIAEDIVGLGSGSPERA